MAYVTAKEDWVGADHPDYEDLNRIEGNIAYLKAQLDALSSTLSAHTGDSTIHKTAAQIRADSSVPLVMEVRDSDPASPVTGSLWCRSDI